jgi:hypothetical protein
MADDVLEDEVAAALVDGDVVLEGPTHRQRVAFTHVFGQLGARVATEAKSAASTLGVTVDVRLAPARCIVQLGPVALTLAWLGGPRDGIVDGQLLLMLWEGNVAPPHEATPERRGPARAARPTAIWEQSLAPVPIALEWGWREGTDTAAPLQDNTRVALACVDRLLAAYAERTAG